jgi:hypothetical protein
LQFHQEEVLVGGEVVEDVVTAVANRGDAELEQFLLQLFLSDHIQVTLDYFLRVNFLELIVEVQTAVLWDLIFTRVQKTSELVMNFGEVVENGRYKQSEGVLFGTVI